MKLITEAIRAKFNFLAVITSLITLADGVNERAVAVQRVSLSGNFMRKTRMILALSRLCLQSRLISITPLDLDLCFWRVLPVG